MKGLKDEEDCLKKAKEDTHYSIQVTSQITPGFFTASVRCHNSKCRAATTTKKTPP